MAIAAIVGIIYAMLFGLDASGIDLGSAEHSRGTEISKQAKEPYSQYLATTNFRTITKQSIP